MKRLSIFLAVGLVFFSVLGLNFVNPTTVSAVTNNNPSVEAQTYCNGAGAGGLAGTCSKSYDYGRAYTAKSKILGRSLKQACPNYKKVISGSGASAADKMCVSSWLAGQKAAATWCRKNAASDQTKCKSTYNKGVGNMLLSVACPSNGTGPTTGSNPFGNGQLNSVGICTSYWQAGHNTAGIAMADAAPSSPAGGGSGGASEDSLGCHFSILSGLNPLNWLICGAVMGMSQIIGVLDDAIMSQLAVGTDGSSDQPNKIFDDAGGCTAKFSGGTNACDNYYTAWKSFRNIALGLMVIAGLIVIVSQAIGIEMLDAYTIRKILPRFLVAALGITLSWQLMQFFVTLSNDLGYGIRYLIYQPFTIHASINLSSLGANGTVLIGALAGVAIGAFGMLTFAGMGALALLVAFITLVIRQLVIIMLIIMAPIGIAAYILPNTQRFYKLWWESFSKALLMFPMIAGMIAIGHVFSAIASQAGSNVINQIVAIFAYFGPYFMIPMTFRFAGGIMSAAGGFVNSRAAGGYGFLAQKRKANTSNRLARARAGRLWREDFGQFGNKGRSVGKIASRVAELGLDADEQIPFMLGAKNVPGFKGYYHKTRNTLDSLSAQHTQKLAQKMESDGNLNKQAYRAMTGTWGKLDSSTHEALATSGFLSNVQRDSSGKITGADMHMPTSREDYLKLAEIMDTSASHDDRIGALGLRNVAGMVSTKNSDPETMRANVLGAALIGQAARGYAEDTDIERVGNQIIGETGRAEFAQRIVAMAEKTGQSYHPEAKFGHSFGVEQNAEGKTVLRASHEISDRALDTISSIKNSDWSQAKGDAIRERFDQLADLASETEYDPVTKQNVLTGRAQGIRNTIVTNASSYGNGEPDAKAQWNKLIKTLDAKGGDQALATQVAAYDRLSPDEAARRGGAAPPPEPPPPLGGAPDGH